MKKMKKVEKRRKEEREKTPPKIMFTSLATASVNIMLWVRRWIKPARLTRRCGNQI